MKKILSAILFVCYFLPSVLCAESDRLWLTYCKQSPEYSQVINDYCKKITLPGSSFDQIIKKEFNTYCTAATGHKPAYGKKGQIVMTYGGGPEIGSEGYVIRCTDHKIRITASADAGFLYATYHLIRLFRTEQLKNDTTIVETRLLISGCSIIGTIWTATSKEATQAVPYGNGRNCLPQYRKDMKNMRA